MGELWLIRHGETEWSRDGKHTSTTDLPLTPEGIERAIAIKRLLDGRRFDQVLCSPLRRAVDTCKLAGYGDKYRTEEDLKEWSYGQYEGRTTLEIQRESPGWTIWTVPPPGWP